MSLGLSGSAYLLDRAKGSKAESRSATIRTTGNDTAAIQQKLLSCIDNAMEQFEQRQRSHSCQAIYSKQAIKMPRARETYFTSVEVESVGSSKGQYYFGDPGGHTP